MPKRYTVEEANALLPYLAPTLLELRDKLEKATRIREQIRRASVTNGWSEKREKWSRTLARVQELITRFEEWEVILRDIEAGIVDFPSDKDGEDVLLCWRLGETDVSHWHSPEDGFQGRRAL